MSEDTQKLLDMWAKTFNRSSDELADAIKEQILVLQSAVPGKSAVWYEQRARWRVYNSLKGRRSQASDYNVLVLAVGEDRNAIRMKDALARYAEDPAKAVAAEYTNAQGVPIDNVPEWGDGRKNPFYRRPLRPLRTVAALVDPLGPDDTVDRALRVFSNVLVSGEPANIQLVVGATYKVRLNQAREQPSKIRTDLNSATVTKFVDPIKPTLDARGLCDELSNAPKELTPELNVLLEWHSENQNDPRRLVILEGDLMYINRTPMANGAYMAIIEDESLGMLPETRGITLFVPAEHYESRLKSIGQGSHVYVIGRTSVGPGWNTETRSIDESKEAVLVNAIGIVADPDMIVSPDEENAPAAADDEARA